MAAFRISHTLHLRTLDGRHWRLLEQHWAGKLVPHSSVVPVCVTYAIADLTTDDSRVLLLSIHRSTLNIVRNNIVSNALLLMCSACSLKLKGAWIMTPKHRIKCFDMIWNHRLIASSSALADNEVAVRDARKCMTRWVATITTITSYTSFASLDTDSLSYITNTSSYIINHKRGLSTATTYCAGISPYSSEIIPVPYLRTLSLRKLGISLRNRISTSIILNL